MQPPQSPWLNQRPHLDVNVGEDNVNLLYKQALLNNTYIGMQHKGCQLCL